jgi:hypothetical protein
VMQDRIELGGNNPIDLDDGGIDLVLFGQA